MEIINIKGTEDSPSIILDKENSLFKIYGCSIPSNSEKIYGSVLDWFNTYLLEQNDVTVLDFELDYFNTSTQKYLADLFKIINAKRDKSKTLKVLWKYPSDDEDMKMIGKQFEQFVDFNFEFIES